MFADRKEMRALAFPAQLLPLPNLLLRDELAHIAAHWGADGDSCTRDQAPALPLIEVKAEWDVARLLKSLDITLWLPELNM